MVEELLRPFLLLLLVLWLLLLLPWATLALGFRTPWCGIALLKGLCRLVLFTE